MAKVKGAAIVDSVRFLRRHKDEARKHLPPALHHYLAERVLAASWYPEEDLVPLVRAMARIQGESDARFFEKAGRLSARAHAQGIYRHLAAGDRDSLTRRALVLWGSQHDTGVMEMEVESSGKVRVALRDFGAALARVLHAERRLHRGDVRAERLRRRPGREAELLRRSREGLHLAGQLEEDEGVARRGRRGSAFRGLAPVVVESLDVAARALEDVAHLVDPVRIASERAIARSTACASRRAGRASSHTSGPASPLHSSQRSARRQMRPIASASSRTRRLAGVAEPVDALAVDGLGSRQALVLELLERRVDGSGAGAVEAAGARLELAHQLVAVLRAVGEQREQCEAQLAGTEEAAAQAASPQSERLPEPESMAPMATPAMPVVHCDFLQSARSRDRPSGH